MVTPEHAAPRTPLARLWLRIGHRRDGRAPLWIEIAIIAWLFWLYDVINDLAPIRRTLALSNARGLLHFEQSLGLDPELAMNRWLAAHGTLATFASDYYFFAHAIVTLAVLGGLWWWRPARYIRLRTPLVIINLVAFVVFWRYPLAPPRSFPSLGFRDVVADSDAVVSWHSGVLVHDADQFAAMPSLHIAWALWCSVSIWQATRRRVPRALALVYPLLTASVVLATGNHYLMDVLAGAGTAGIGYAAAFAFERALAWRRRRSGASMQASGAQAVAGPPNAAT
jgi:hypothetical protein